MKMKWISTLIPKSVQTGSCTSSKNGSSRQPRKNDKYYLAGALHSSAARKGAFNTRFLKIAGRQPRLPAFLNNHDGFLLEAAAGLLDNLDPETRIKAEAEEETGYRLDNVQKVFEAFMSPGSVTEKLHFFIAEYDASQFTGAGGGIEEEGEDVETVELGFDDALTAIKQGRIVDAKTIMLLQYLALEGVM